MTDIDLNLLRAFEALASERSVTRAATRLGISQPAMSHALNRLRTQLNDPLLVRSSQGLQLSHRAAELLPQIQQALGSIAQALQPTQVTPDTLARTFTMGMADYAELLAVPHITRTLEREAPKASLVCRQSSNPELVHSLEQGTLDLWLGVSPPALSTLYSQKLLTDDFVCAIRHGHPLAGRRLSAKQFAAMRHLQIAPGNTPGGPLDNALAAQGLTRHVAVRVPHFLVAPHLVAQSDMVLTAPRRLLEVYARTLRLRLFSCPVPVPGFTLLQVWHQRVHQDPQHRWFRERVAAIVQRL